jgi:hypothetical protein
MLKAMLVFTGLPMIMLVVSVYLAIPILFLLINLFANIMYLVYQCINKQKEEKCFHIFINSEVLFNVAFTTWLILLVSS